MVDQSSEAPVSPVNRRPVRKVGSGAISGAVTTVIVWLIGATGVPVPPEVAAALTTIMTFVVAYLVPTGT
jgi:hypothetical protein